MTHEISPPLLPLLPPANPYKIIIQYRKDGRKRLASRHFIGAARGTSYLKYESTDILRKKKLCEQILHDRENTARFRHACNGCRVRSGVRVGEEPHKHTYTPPFHISLSYTHKVMLVNCHHSSACMTCMIVGGR